LLPRPRSFLRSTTTAAADAPLSLIGCTGTLDRKELRNALEALGMEGTRENVRAAMKRYDDDRSRTLDLGEFTQMVRDLLEQQMAIEDAAADAAVAATPGLSPTSAAGSAVKYARAVGRDSPGAY